MNWLNPANWIKAGIANSADQAIDTNVTLEKGKAVALLGVNNVIGLTESKINDDELRKYADAFINGGTALVKLGKGIHPDGEGGRKLTLGELDEIYTAIDDAFGNIIPEEKVAAFRKQLKAYVRTKLGID